MAIYSTQSAPSTQTQGGQTDWAAQATPTAAADWSSASAFGAATSVFIEDGDYGVRISTDRASNGAATNGSRVQGALQSMPAGDFEFRMRASLDRRDVTAVEAVNGYEATFIFVDGDNVDDDSNYGVGIYFGNDTVASADINRYSNTAGANRFESRSYDATLSNTPLFGIGPLDISITRSGTSVTVSMCNAGGVPQALYTWTSLSTEAALAGVRIQHFSDVATDLHVCVAAAELVA